MSMAMSLLALILLANASPILVARLLGPRADWPLDLGLILGGQPLLGPSKTWRGLVTALLCTGIGAQLMGLGYGQGLLIASLAMLGDLLASFIKRRLGIPASGMALFLDQIPESLLPAIVMMGPLGLDWGDVLILVLLFLVIELMLSRLGYQLRIRKRPY